ncbi:MAG: hypothetical protein SGCHY_002938, partial [Lobulomycetales sp.]
SCYFAGDFCTFVEDFSTPLSAQWFAGYDGSMSTDFVVESGRPEIIDGNLHLPLVDIGNSTRGAATILSTTRFLMYGSFEVRLRTAPTSSVVSAFIGVSNLYDEIDLEWTPGARDGTQENVVQSNWYYRAERIFDVNAREYSLSSNTFDNFHTYRVDWTPETIQWRANGVVFNQVVRSELGDAEYRYPATPMRISFGVWQGGDSNLWSGPNMVNFTQVPPQSNSVIIDYMKVIGRDCGGGDPDFDPQQSSAGFQDRPPVNGFTFDGVGTRAVDVRPISSGSALAVGIATLSCLLFLL